MRSAKDCLFLTLAPQHPAASRTQQATQERVHVMTHKQHSMSQQSKAVMYTDL